MNKNYKNNNIISIKKNPQITIFLILYLIFVVVYLLFQIIIVDKLKIMPDSEQIANEDIIVNRDLVIIDELKTEEEKRIFLQDVTPVYIINDSIFYSQWNYFDKIFKFILKERPIPQEIKRYIENQTEIKLTDTKIIPLLILIADNEYLTKLFRNFLYNLYSKGITFLDSTQILSNSKNVVLVEWFRQYDSIQKEINAESFITYDRMDEKIEEYYNLNFKGSILDQNLYPEDKEIFIEFVKNNLKENLFYDQLHTDELKNSVLKEFKPKTIKLEAGTIIAKKGEKLSLEQKRLILLIQRALKSNRILTIISNFILLCLICFIIVFYLFNFSNSFRLYKRYSVYFFILIFLSFLFYIVYQITKIIFIPLFYVYPLFLIYLLIEFAYSEKDKFLVYLSITFILFFISNFDYIFLFYSLIIFTFLTLFPFKFSSYKKTIFSKFTIALIITLIFAIIINFIFSKNYKITDLLIAGSINITLSTILFFGLTPLLENIFNFPTIPKLLEICDLNNQFFSDFMLKAPGTYHHSVIVATIAEKAAASCNANPYIARAGGLYHDIGKIKYSKYFVENQHGENPTVDVLNPNMAVTIIKNHVKYGIIEAKKLHLPREIIDIIEQHHGTSLISYFYVKALEKKLDNIEKEYFCYNYPKPKTKEAAIIMIVDSVEAASRTLKNADKKSIEKIVEDVISNKSKEGQLEESPITLSDLSKIKNSIINSLYSMFHNRINYPDENELKKLEENNK